VKTIYKVTVMLIKEEVLGKDAIREQKVIASNTHTFDDYKTTEALYHKLVGLSQK